MDRSRLPATAVALLVAIGATAPAQARPFHRHHAARYMAAGGHAAPQPPIAPPESVLLTPAMRNAERAITWQDSLHGEANN